MTRINTPRRWVASHDDIPGSVWLAIFLLFSIWVFHRLGAFDLWSTVTGSDGTAVRVVNTFASVDHPFHATRAETLRQSLGDGRMLRWVANHQGGYPAEFYPLGAAAFEVSLWALALGALPVMAIHKIAVIAIFLLPAAGFALLARADRLPYGVAFLATVMHVSVRGWWWSGGYMELVEWGLLSNVASSVSLLVTLPFLYRASREASLRSAGLAVIFASFSVYSNTRSVIPLVVIAAGITVAQLIDRRMSRASARSLWLIFLVGGLTALVCAPLLIPLLRFDDLYYFVRYSKYAGLLDYWHSSVQAVSGPFSVLTIAGVAGAIMVPQLKAVRAVVVTLALYIIATALTGDRIEQLEATRLMPFQRLLMLYLAAVGTYLVLDLAVRRFSRASRKAIDVLVALAALVTLLAYVVVDTPGIPSSDRAMAAVPTTGVSDFAALEQAIRLADRHAPQGTAILVLGSRISWHDQLWAPQWSDRPFFYDDWLWYWQKDHVGPYDPLTEHAYDIDSATLTQSYFSQHGIGAVVVTGEAARAASRSLLLNEIASGTYSVYTVLGAVGIVTSGDSTAGDIEIENQRIAASFGSPVSTALVRRNWYPRWKATIGDHTAGVEKDDAGYMRVSGVGPGSLVELTYQVDAWDWMSRLLCVAGLAGTGALVVAPRRMSELDIPSKMLGKIRSARRMLI